MLGFVIQVVVVSIAVSILSRAFGLIPRYRKGDSRDCVDPERGNPYHPADAGAPLRSSPILNYPVCPRLPAAGRLCLVHQLPPPQKEVIRP